MPRISNNLGDVKKELYVRGLNFTSFARRYCFKTVSVRHVVNHYIRAGIEPQSGASLAIYEALEHALAQPVTRGHRALTNGHEPEPRCEESAAISL